MARLGHRRRKLGASIVVLARLVHFRQADHDSTLVHFQGVAAAVVTVSFSPAASSAMLHEAAFLIPLNVLLAVLGQRVLFVEWRNRIAICIPARQDGGRCVESARIWSVFVRSSGAT